MIENSFKYIIVDSKLIVKDIESKILREYKIIDDEAYDEYKNNMMRAVFEDIEMPETVFNFELHGFRNIIHARLIREITDNEEIALLNMMI